MNKEQIESLNKCLNILKNSSSNEELKKMIDICNNKNLNKNIKLKKLSHEYYKNKKNVN